MGSPETVNPVLDVAEGDGTRGFLHSGRTAKKNPCPLSMDFFRPGRPTPPVLASVLYATGRCRRHYSRCLWRRPAVLIKTIHGNSMVRKGPNCARIIRGAFRGQPRPGRRLTGLQGAFRLEYKCPQCGLSFSRVVLRGDEDVPASCPACAAAGVRPDKGPASLFEGISNFSSLAKDTN